MYLGIDLGTSGVKAVLVDDDQNMLAQGNAALDVSRPQPLWSEQNPEHWWNATLAAVAEIKAAKPDLLASVRGIGLSGQMHGATLLDDQDGVLRPAILWN
ncbi:MAG: xylulokinase, partial [Rhodospirillales bacterium]|nr:xylulokinase [Rhodospirillales bacterium]